MFNINKNDLTQHPGNWELTNGSRYPKQIWIFNCALFYLVRCRSLYTLVASVSSLSTHFKLQQSARVTLWEILVPEDLAYCWTVWPFAKLSPEAALSDAVSLLCIWLFFLSPFLYFLYASSVPPPHRKCAESEEFIDSMNMFQKTMVGQLLF